MTALEKAQALCKDAEAVLITAGAGMGVDSGLPDFRGNEGFWNAYPPYRDLGFNFMEMACPDRFEDEPELGWGFYGHRRNLYRSTEPHEGFERLLNFAKDLPGGYFVFTSNVDGHFQRSGFDPDRVLECHGSIQHEQCFRGCRRTIWESTGQVTIDESTMRACRPLPECPVCHGISRPNILMFGDWGWNPERTEAQQKRYGAWLMKVVKMKVAILEFGAGKGVPTVRRQSELMASSIPGAGLVRVNPRESDIPSQIANGASLESGALEAIRRILGDSHPDP